MSAVPPHPRVKHRAATRRVPRTRATDTESAAAPDPEPNMRLSRAILVMLLLHIVAVGGILAFSLIKEHGRSHAVTSPTSNAVEAEDSDAQSTKVEGRNPARNSSDSDGALTNARPDRSSDTLTRVTNDPASNNNPPPNTASDAAERIAGGRSNNNTASTMPTPTSGDKGGRLPADSGKTYVVKKGDSPFTIADRLKVDAASLLRLNGIDDPKKLRPGQTLHIPTASRGKSK